MSQSTQSTRPDRYDDVAGEPGLLGWAGVFAGRNGPRLLIAAFVVAVARRLHLGGWRAADGVVAAGVIAAHPFTEWLVHVHLLHRRPHRRRGRDVELYVARMHRLHHDDPKDIDLVLLPFRVVVGLVAGLVVVAATSRDRRLGATGVLAACNSLLVYEWVHFLIHSPYRPRRAYYRARWRTHRLHHYRNEGYWFGVVGASADRILGTAPPRGDVPVSGTARTLAAQTASPGDRPVPTP